MMIAGLAIDNRISQGLGDVRSWSFPVVIEALILQDTLNAVTPEPEQPSGR